MFAVQLSIHYDVSLLTAVYWAFSDWYLWGIIALGMYGCARLIRSRVSEPSVLALIAMTAAPVIISLHVSLTIVIGSIVEPEVLSDFSASFAGLFSKKITINAIAYTVLLSLIWYRVFRVTDADWYIVGRQDESARRIRPNEIFYVQASGNHIVLHTRNGQWLVRQPLKSIEKQLLERGFFRVSRFAIVNISFLDTTDLDNGRIKVKLKNGQTLVVSRRFQSGVRQLLLSRSPQ